MRCESAHESTRVRIWNVIYTADNGLVWLNNSTRPTKVIEVLLAQLSQSANQFTTER